jgi:cytochrome c biogenesis factor
MFLNAGDDSICFEARTDSHKSHLQVERKKTRSAGIHSRRLSPLCPAMPEAVHLLLGWKATIVRNPCFNNSLFLSLFLASSVLAVWGLARAMRKHVPGIRLFLWLILLYPAVYYIVFPQAQYRHPIEPELGILMVYIVSQTERKGQRREETSYDVKQAATVHSPARTLNSLTLVHLDAD